MYAVVVKSTNTKTNIGLLRTTNTARYRGKNGIRLASSSNTTFPGCKYHAVFAALNIPIFVLLLLALLQHLQQHT
jgi:hypothetical protein